MPLEIYFDLFSQPCRSVYIFAKKNNIPFEHKEMSLFQGAQYGEEFGKISILRKLPAIKDGDFCLAESVSILVYLTEKFQTPDHWYPADLQKRARVNEYLSWQHTSIRLYGAKVMIPKGLKAEVPKEKVDSILEYFEWSLKLFEEKFLQDRPFIAGDQISLADLVAIVELMQPLGAGLDVFESRPKLQAWKDRVRKAIGAELFDESHQRILSLRETVETMDFTALEAMKSRLLKYFLS